MKRLTLFAAALAVAMSSFAKITYELDGGVTNDWGWQTPQDMYNTLEADYKEHNPAQASKVWTPLADLTPDAPNLGIPTCADAMDLTFLENNKFKLHFGWLITYMDAKCTEQAQTLPSSNASYLRYNLAAFFQDGHRTSWPASANYATCGVSTYDAYGSTWKAAFANPEEPTAEFVLNAPYREGAVFMGWYNNAEFTGEKVTKVDATTGDITLYAKWDVIPNTKEFAALDNGTQTKLIGTVTINLGGKFWIQDTYGAVEAYLEDNTLEEGTLVVLQGEKTVKNGILTLDNVELVSSEKGTAIVPADATVLNINSSLDAYINKYVALTGVRLVYNEDTTKVYIQEASTLVEIFKLTPDSTMKADIEQGGRVNANVIVSSYNNKLQFRTLVDKIAPVSAVGVDTIQYPARGENGEYTLTNKWIYSNVLKNYSDNYPAHNGFGRGMVAKDGIMYFADRENKQLVRIDGETGKMLDPIKLADNIFTHTFKAQDGSDSIAATPATLNYNDIKIDSEGHILLGNCVSAGQWFQIWKVDETTGAGTLVMEDRLADQQRFAARDNINIHYFGVWGDVDGEAVIMAGNSGVDGKTVVNVEAFRWEIEEGALKDSVSLVSARVTAETKNSYLVSDKGEVATCANSATQVFPSDKNYFYFDSHPTFATRLNKTGAVIGDFKQAPHTLNVWNEVGDTITMNQGHNGVLEFQIGNDYFLIVAATNTAGSPASSFALFKFADQTKKFEEIQPMWYFPQDGMGGGVNGYRTAVPSVDVDQETGLATIYLYTGEVGYAVYEFQGVAAPIEDGLQNPTMDNVKVRKVLRNGQVVIIRDGVEYNILGAQVK